MVKVEYFLRCKIVETYYTQNKGSHEPGYIIPLLAFCGKLKFFPLPLYRFSTSGIGHSQFQAFDHVIKFYAEYFFLCKATIEALPDFAPSLKGNSDIEKKRLEAAARLGCLRYKYYSAKAFPDSDQNASSILREVSEFVDELFTPAPAYTIERLIRQQRKLFPAIENILLHSDASQYIKTDGLNYTQIIGYGVLGRSGKSKLEALEGTPLYPTVLWDAAAVEDSKIDGNPVYPPDFDSLTDGDFIVALPGDISVQEELKALFKEKSVNNKIFFQEIEPKVFSPELLYENLYFVPEQSILR